MREVVSGLDLRVRLRRAVVGLAFAMGAAVPLAHAEPSVPWTPSLSARHAIALLVDDAGLELITMQWPLPRAAVARALDALPTSLPPALDEARELVKRELRAQDGSQFSLTVRNRGDALTGFGDDSTPGSSVSLRSSTLSNPLFALQVGGRVEARANADLSGSQFRLDDTAIATELLGIQLQAWSHRSWWSPGWQTSLALSNNAPAFNGIGFQRASASTSESPWLSWMGPWNFDFFVAQAEDVRAPANPFFVGARLTLRPFSHVEIGITRTAQWGGEGRHPSVGSFWRLLTGGDVNADTVAEQPRDPGNEMAGFDVRVRCPTGLRCAGYGQLIGEDQAGILPSRYLGTYGFEFWSEDGGSRYFAEYTEPGCRTPIGRPPLKGCAYRNYAYPGGYVNAGRWIGAGVGPDSRLLTLGWIDAAHDRSVKLQYGSVGSRIGTFSPLVDDPQNSGHLIGVSAQQGFAWGAATVTPELSWLRIDAPSGTRTDARVGVNLRMNLDAAVSGAGGRLGSSLSSSNGDMTEQVLVGAGLVAGAALLDKAADRYAQGHGSNPSAKALRHVGDAIPFAAIGLAGLSWATQRGSTQGDLGFTAASAGLSAVLASELIKVAVDRARPSAELGAGSFGNTKRAQSSFPSIHSTLAWAVLTPYAEHYDAPWLYGVAALTNAARVMGREHWFSDTVAGAAIGYWIGDRFYRQSSAAADAKPGPRLWLTPRSVVLQVPFD